MVVSKADFSKLAGVSRAAITQGITRGKLVQTPEGHIDLDDPVIVEYMSRRAAADQPKPPAPVKQQNKQEPKEKPKAKPKTEQEKKPEPKKDPEPQEQKQKQHKPKEESQEDDSYEGLGLLSLRKIRAEIRYKTEATETYRIKRLERMGLLVEREKVRQVLGKLNAELKVRLLEMPATIAPRLVAMARAGTTEHEIAEIMAEEIERAVEGAKTVARSAGLDE